MNAQEVKTTAEHAMTWMADNKDKVAELAMTAGTFVRLIKLRNMRKNRKNWTKRDQDKYNFLLFVSPILLSLARINNTLQERNRRESS